MGRGGIGERRLTERWYWGEQQRGGIGEGRYWGEAVNREVVLGRATEGRYWGGAVLGRGGIGERRLTERWYWGEVVLGRRGDDCILKPTLEMDLVKVFLFLK